jgi:thymidylate synthase
MMMKVSDIREYFKGELAAERFTIDKTGAKTIEMLGASFIADEESIFGKPAPKYIQAELDWYESQSTNINDIHGEEKEPPAAWVYSANDNGEINSNYGHLVNSPKFYNQYYNAIDELIKNPDSRRAQMIYNRPSIWVEYNENGKSDFICTNAQTFYIRDNKLHMVSQMRSNDVVFGYKNDYAWAQHLMDRAIDNLNEEGYKLTKGDLTWQVMNLHVYDRHFELVG